MKILLLGSNGMLGKTIYKKLTSLETEVSTVARSNADYCFDLTDDARLESCIKEERPAVVINAAAIVDIEFCEKNPGLAYQINTRIPGVLADICKRKNIYLVHISTDHYYCGDGSRKHKETDPVTLVNEYARTKYLGEQLILAYKDSLILRTNIVGFKGDKKETFIEWAVTELENNTRLNLFTDFYTSSIHTRDFANIFADLLKWHPTGIFNLASSDVKSKKDFIIGLSSLLFNREPVYTEASVRDIDGTKRAESLGLDTSKIENLLGYKMPGFEETLESIKKVFLKESKISGADNCAGDGFRV